MNKFVYFKMEKKKKASLHLLTHDFLRWVLFLRTTWPEPPSPLVVHRGPSSLLSARLPPQLCFPRPSPPALPRALASTQPSAALPSPPPRSSTRDGPTAPVPRAGLKLQPLEGDLQPGAGATREAGSAFTGLPCSRALKAIKERPFPPR